MAQRNISFAIYSETDELIILNKYEQQLQQELHPGTPLQIMDKDHVLSDGISKTYKCLFENETYFIRHTELEPKILKQCTVLEDTIRIIRSGTKIKYADDSEGTLQNGQVVKRRCHVRMVVAEFRLPNC